MLDEVVAYTDGGSRGNPGPAAAAFILTGQGGARVSARGFFLGRTTNNVAEYTALCKALVAARDAGARRVRIFSDSELLVRQLNGRYKVKSEKIRPLFNQAFSLLKDFEHSDVKFVPRQQNKEADQLVNQVLDLGRDVESSRASEKTIRLGVLISGGGTTLMNILDYIKKSRLNAEIPVVDLDVLQKDYPDIDEFSRRVEQELDAADVDLVVQAGWLCLWKIPQRYENRVMNIHPALLPSFGGKGMWGRHVHEAVLKAGCKVSGCTVHFCTNEYDRGPIIVQRCCEVKDDDTPETLAARVFEQECIAYPQAVRLFQQGKIDVQDGRVRTK